MKTLIVKRVPYAKDATPVAEREYKVTGRPSSPVGNQEEIEWFAKDQGCDSVVFIEKDGSERTVDIQSLRRSL